MDKLGEIMSKNVTTVHPQENVFSVAKKMREQNIGMVPVVENGQLKGIVTDRDLVTRGIAQKKPNSSDISAIMSTDIISGTPEMPVEEAARLMAAAQVRRLPVIKNNQVVGVVSLGDLAVKQPYQQEAAQALNEISETHDPQASNDLE